MSIVFPPALALCQPRALTRQVRSKKLPLILGRFAAPPSAPPPPPPVLLPPCEPGSRLTAAVQTATRQQVSSRTDPSTVLSRAVRHLPLAAGFLSPSSLPPSSSLSSVRSMASELPGTCASTTTPPRADSQLAVLRSSPPLLAIFLSTTYGGLRVALVDDEGVGRHTEEQQHGATAVPQRYPLLSHQDRPPIRNVKPRMSAQASRDALFIDYRLVFGGCN